MQLLKRGRMKLLILAVLVAVIGLASFGMSRAEAQVLFPSLDHFLGYKIGFSPAFAPQTVLLRDQFEAGSFDVLKPVRLFNPSRKIINDEVNGVIDARVHLKGYTIQSTPGIGPVHEVRKDLVVVNQFGAFRVDTVKPYMLLVPTAKQRNNPDILPLDPASHFVDHFKCYTIKLKASYSAVHAFPIQPWLEDQFLQGKRYDLEKPTLLCNPVAKLHNGVETPVKNPHTHLLCYPVKPAPGEPVHVSVINLYTNNQFGRERLRSKIESELCVPSRKHVPQPFVVAADGIS